MMSNKMTGLVEMANYKGFGFITHRRVTKDVVHFWLLSEQRFQNVN